jgi:hypothetical protein
MALTASEALQNSYSIGNRDFSLEIRWPERKADHSSNIVSRLRKGGAINPLSYMIS